MTAPKTLPRVLIIPRSGATPEDDFYPWLSMSIKPSRMRPLGDPWVLDMPNPSRPQIKAWTDTILEAIAREPERPTLIVAHSLGVQALLRALARAPESTYILGALFVAGWWNIDKASPAIRPWLNDDIDWRIARFHLGPARVLLSTDDPYTADYASTAQRFTDWGADVVLERRAKHFNRGEEPAVFREYVKLLAQVSQSPAESLN